MASCNIGGFMQVAIGSDHSGYEMKKHVINVLRSLNIACVDYGANSSKVSVNYIDYALKISQKIANKEYDFGILICNDGIGMSIVANKVKGIRCALCYNSYCAKIAREHNDANILALGRIMDFEEVTLILKNWFESDFKNGRHEKRMQVLFEYEDHYLRNSI